MASPVSSAASASEASRVPAGHRQRFRHLGAVRAVFGDIEFARGARTDQRADQCAIGHERHARRPGEALGLERGRNASLGILGQANAPVERRAGLHRRERALLGRERAPRKAAPAQQRGDFLHRRRCEIGAVLARRQRARRPADQREAFARLPHLAFKGRRVPREASVPGLHCLVRAVIETPLQVERGRRVPVALALRVGEAAPHRPGGVDADEVESGGRREHFVDHDLRRRKRRCALVAASRDLGRQQQQRIVGKLRQHRAQARDRLAHGTAVRREIAGQRQRMLGVPRSADQPQRQVALRDRAGLADLAAVHPDEVGFLGVERSGEALARLQGFLDDRRERLKIVFHSGLLAYAASNAPRAFTHRLAEALAFAERTGRRRKRNAITARSAGASRRPLTLPRRTHRRP